MKEGLLGGTLTTAWALLDVAGRAPGLDYRGVKRVDGRSLHEVTYAPRESSDLTVLLYFEADSFRHVMTKYSVIQPVGMGRTPGQSPGLRETRHTLVERFGEFRVVDGLTLPHSYSIEYALEGQSASFLATWGMAIQQIVNNSDCAHRRQGGAWASYL